MKTVVAIMIGAGVFALSVDSGMAAVRHHRHHATYRAHAVQAPAQSTQSSDLMVDGNNPAKRYSTRHMSEGSVKTSTLYGSGNNPAKSYPTRQAPSGASQQPTLMNSGNNPAKRAAATNGAGH
jgi:hypothetical protein